MSSCRAGPRSPVRSRNARGVAWRGVAPSLNGAVAVSQAVAELRKSGLEMNFSFLNYAQSGQCRNWEQSSVSYAAGALYVH